MKSQVVISTGRIFETIFYFNVTSYSLSIGQIFLGRNTFIGYNGLKALVGIDPYNSLKDYIHTDIVGSGGAFMLVIDALREDHSKN